MARYTASSYNLGASLGNVNAENGWGPYKWPGGVPENLLANFSYQQINGAKQIVRGRVREELVELFELAAALADQIHGYQIWSFYDGENWGPWTYENRAISGTSSASNHSKGRAWDINAPWNGYANGFSAIGSDIPPALVNAYESIGLSWGGRYGDAMHFEYARTPGDVASDVRRARGLLGGQVIGTPPDKPPAEQDWFDMATQNDLYEVLVRPDVTSNIAREVMKELAGYTDGQYPYASQARLKVAGAVWDQGLKSATDGKVYPAQAFLTSIDARVLDIQKRIGGLDRAQLDSVARWIVAQLDDEPDPAAPAESTHKVVAGDTFNAIAAKYGVTPDALAAANPLVKDRSALDIGQVLTIPKA